MTLPPLRATQPRAWMPILLLGLLPLVTLASGEPSPAHLDPWCQALWEAYAPDAPVHTRRLPPGNPARPVDRALLAEGRLRLLLDTGPGGGPAAALHQACTAHLPSMVWEGSAGRCAQVHLAIEELPNLRQIPGLAWAGRPRTGIALENQISEGAAEIGALPYQARHGGGGIRIGILDKGFAGYQALLGTELPADTRTRAFFGSPDGEGDITGLGNDHGTACAEIAHDVAPRAQLFLANAETLIELEAAVRWLRDEGVSIISHSIGWFDGPGDGTGPIHDIVAIAQDAGILWVNAAGNQAQEHWGGWFCDPDADSLHAFDAAEDESLSYPPGEGGRTFTFFLTWDRWPYSPDLAFEIELYEDGEPVAATAGTPASYYAFRSLTYTRTSLEHRLDLVIRRTVGDSAAWLRLFRHDPPHTIGEHQRAAGSLLIPADGPDVLSVGAYRVGEGFLEDFSSRGPTRTGLVKPELCAPDYVTTATQASFGGTSAACPHAAGAAALLLASAPPGGFYDFHWTCGELRALLAAAAAPDGFTDPEACRWGLLRLPSEASAPAGGAAPLALRSPTRGLLWGRWDARGAGPLRVSVHDATGRLLARRTLASAPPRGRWLPLWDGCTCAGPVASGLYWIEVASPGGRWCGRALIVR